MNQTYAVTVAPTEQPVTLTEAKAQLRITSDAENVRIEKFVEEATDTLQERINRQIVTATIVLKLDNFPFASNTNRHAEILIPRGPSQSVTSILYDDTDGVEQTLSSANYSLESSDPVGRIRLASGESWPSVKDQQSAVRVTYVAGYGAASAVPARIKGIILKAVEDLFEHRGAQSEIALKLNATFDRLLDLDDFRNVA